MQECVFTIASPNEKGAARMAAQAQSVPLIAGPLIAPVDRLPEIESAVVEPLNRIFCCDRRASFEWPDGSACTVRLRPGFTHRLPADLQIELSIEARFGPHGASIGLASAAFLELLEGENAALLPPEIKCALLESYLENAVRKFEQAAGLAIRMASLTHDLQALPDRGYNLFFEIFSRPGLSAATGFISVDLDGIRCLAGLLDRQDAPCWRERIAGLPIAVGFVLGSTRLRLSQIDDLAGEDIILLDGLPGESGPARPIRIDLGRRTFWMAEMTGSRVVVQTRVERSMGDADAADREHEEIELELIFELGRRIMPLAEVHRIGPGYSFDLAADSIEPVSILINGRRVGCGELVHIDHRLGVRLTHYHQRLEHSER